MQVDIISRVLQKLINYLKQPSVIVFSSFAVLAFISGIYFYDTRMDIFRYQAVMAIIGMWTTVFIYKRIDLGFHMLRFLMLGEKDDYR